MEELLQYTWKHKLFPLSPLKTTDGKSVEVIDPGLQNRNAGPDFFNAKVNIGGTLWVGNVEIHLKASDWRQHGHDRDPRYNNVILHVCEQIDSDVQDSRGEFITQMQLDVPDSVRRHYQQLMDADRYPPCYKIIPTLTQLTLHAWLSALTTERLERKTEDIRRRADLAGGSWEDAYFVTLARNFGFGINGDAFEQWAQCVPLKAVAHHRDDLFQVETIFMGQAGLLNPETIPEYHRQSAEQDGYFMKLRNEYQYLAHKFNLKPMDAAIWRFLRLRPQNFPHIRISQLAWLHHQYHTGLSQLLDCTTLPQLRQLLATQATPYWQSHYTFGSPPTPLSAKQLTATSLNLLILNTAVPMFFAVGRHRQREELCDRAFDLLEQLKAENNHIVRLWSQCGLTARTAAESQALIQLKQVYCDRKDCLRCRIGYEYLKHPTNE
jgi:hypothetical protein